MKLNVYLCWTLLENNLQRVQNKCGLRLRPGESSEDFETWTFLWAQSNPKDSMAQRSSNPSLSRCKFWRLLGLYVYPFLSRIPGLSYGHNQHLHLASSKRLHLRHQLLGLFRHGAPGFNCDLSFSSVTNCHCDFVRIKVDANCENTGEEVLSLPKLHLDSCW